MFSLIITIISIALVAALAVATIYYGGSAFSNGSAKAKASALVTQAQQIAASEVLYFNDFGSYDTTDTDALLAGLTGTNANNAVYLTSVPQPAAPTAAYTVKDNGNGTFTISATGVPTSVCGAPNVFSGPAKCDKGTFTYTD